MHAETFVFALYFFFIIVFNDARVLGCVPTEALLLTKTQKIMIGLCGTNSSFSTETLRILKQYRLQQRKENNVALK